VPERKDLVGIEPLTKAEILHLLDRSDAYFQDLLSTDPMPKRDMLQGRTVANLFFENSTRTRTSFELAEKRLGAEAVSLSMQTSSLSKGESLVDMINVITAMKIDAVVVRHQSPGVPQLFQKHLPANIRIINGGDGAHEHPTQALLDAATMREMMGDLHGKNIVIVGDIMHSRVARSNIYLLNKLGANVSVVGPTTLMPRYIQEVYDIPVSYKLDGMIQKADAVIMLRIQLERQSRAYLPSLGEFRARYGLTAARLNETSAYILHPGPINRAVEIDDEAADAEKSLILRQVKRGVAIRMAVLEWLFS
jgi:aspartate carbamoyltransferase catalytic subunit